MSALDFFAALLWAFLGALSFHHDATVRRAGMMRLRLQLAALEAGYDIPTFRDEGFFGWMTCESVGSASCGGEREWLPCPTCNGRPEYVSAPQEDT